MPKSSTAQVDKKPTSDRPSKPYPDFPLCPHATGAWQKKIRGKVYYFGKWGRRVNGKLERVPGDGWKDALDEYNDQKDDLYAGRTPRVRGDGLTVGDLRGRFLTSKSRALDAGEITQRTYVEYRATADRLLAAFGKTRLVSDLAADDFELFRASVAKTWVTFPRPKTGIARRCPLWPETIAALQAAKAERPEPRSDRFKNLFFLTKFGRAWTSEKAGDNAVTGETGKILRSLGLHRPGLGFYSIRHTFRTVADGAKDTPAVRLIMGHADGSIDDVYREHIDDARLEAVVAHVHDWLWPIEAKSTGTGSTAISGRMPPVAVEYDGANGRVIREFADPYAARRFYVALDKQGKHPAVRAVEEEN